MGASVRIEDEAFSDLRYDVLALTCGLSDGDHALGKMARLWRQCTQQQTHVLPIEVVVAVLGKNAVEALETACLGEQVEGGIRICGTKGRIEWLGKLRKNARKGGIAKAAKRQPNGNPNACQEAAKTLPPPCPPAPAPAPARSGEREIKKARQLPADWSPTEAHRALASQLRVDLGFEVDQFRDHAAANGRLAKDWDAAFRTWVRKASRFAQGTKPPPPATHRPPKLLIDGYTPNGRRGT